MEEKKAWYTHIWVKVSAIISGIILILSLISNVFDIKDKVFEKKEVIKYDDALLPYCDELYSIYLEHPKSWKNTVDTGQYYFRNLSAFYVHPTSNDVFMILDVDYLIEANGKFTTDSLYQVIISHEGKNIEHKILYKKSGFFDNNELRYATIKINYFNEKRKENMSELLTTTVVNNKDRPPLQVRLRTSCPNSQYNEYMDFFQKIHNSFVLKNCSKETKKKKEK